MRSAAPWRYIPGSWAMPTTAINQHKIAIILGASNRTNVGVVYFDDMEAYDSMDNTRALVIQFVNSQSNEEKILTKKYKVPIYKPTKQYDDNLYPVITKSVAVTMSDLLWLESTVTVVSTFVEEAAQLGGGGKHPGNRTTLLSPLEIYTSLFDNEMIAKMYGCEGQFKGEMFPCLQTIEISTGTTDVRIHCLPTQICLSRAKDAATPVVRRFPDIPPLPEAAVSVQCKICKRTESDVKSRGMSLKLCSRCKNPQLKYCSAECQKIDWSNHKKICEKH